MISFLEPNYYLKSQLYLPTSWIAEIFLYTFEIYIKISTYQQVKKIKNIFK